MIDILISKTNTMNTDTPTTKRKHDDGAIAATKLLLIGSMVLFIIAAVALAFLWYNTSNKDASVEREKEDIKLERQFAKDADKKQSVIVVHVPENLPTIAEEKPEAPVQNSDHKNAEQVSGKSRGQSGVVQPNKKQTKQSKQYLTLSDYLEDYGLTLDLLGSLDRSLLR